MKRICKSFIPILLLLSIVVFPVLAAPQQAGEQQPIVQKSGILAGLVLALALAFGLAGRGKAEKYFNKILKE